MHLLNCKGRDSKLYHADGDYCAVPPRMCQSVLLLLCGAALPAPPALPVPAHSTMSLPWPRCPAEPAPSEEHKLSRGSHSAAAAAAGEIVIRAPMFVTSPRNRASLTLSIWAACSVSPACHFAADASFSCNTASKMLAERRDFPSWFFLFFHCFQKSASFLLSKMQCCIFVIDVFIKWIIDLKALSPNLYIHI